MDAAMTADEALAWVIKYARSMSLEDDGSVTFYEVFPLPDHERVLLGAMRDHHVFTTPAGPRVLTEVMCADGPEGWTFVLDDPRVGTGWR